MSTIGERDADEELLVGVGHRLGLPAQHDAGAGGDVLRRLVQDFLDVGGDGAEVALAIGRENVDDRLHRVMRDDRRAHSAFDRRQAADDLRRILREAGMFSSDETESSQYCGVCATIG